MSGALPFLIQGLGWGFFAGISIGPFLGYIINVVLTRGWRRSLWLITVPPVVDAPIIIVMVFVLGALPEYVLDIMSIIGGSFVLWLGWSTWRDNERTEARLTNTQTSIKREDVADELGVPMGVIYLRGMLVNALNPAPYIFWSTVSGPILLDGLQSGGAGYASVFLLAYYSVFLTLIFVLMQVIGRIGSLDERTSRYMIPVTIVLLVVLGLGLVGAGIFDLVQIVT